MPLLPLTISALAAFAFVVSVSPVRAESDAHASASAKGRPPQPPAVRTIDFSGRNWTVKSSSGRVGPGPNYFSNSTNNVWVDTQGRLHLKITKDKNRWYTAEIVLNQSLGHGTYRFYLDSPVDNLDPNVVLGLFTWNDDPAYAHREIDIEFARWGVAGGLDNAQYVVQPYTIPANIVTFTQPAVAQSTHSFTWLGGSVEFESLRGLNATPPAQSDVIRQWTLSGASTPVPGGENARLNLWLFQGRAPTNGREVEVIVNRFEFIAAP